MRSICKFCNKDLGEIYLSSDDEAPLNQGRPTSHDCDNCNTRYVYMRSGALYGYTLWSYYNGKKFCAHFYMNIPEDYVKAGVVPKARRFALTREGIIEIFTLDFYPDITPSNFQKKLPTLLIFS